MNERVARFRQRQRDSGLSQISLWLDDVTVTLLKQVSEAQRLQPGHVVAMALQQCFGNVSETGSPDINGKRFSSVSEAELLRAIIQDVIRGELACLRNGNATGTEIYISSETVTEGQESIRNATETAQETFQEAQDVHLTEEQGNGLASGETAVVGFAERLKTARERAGISQRELAKESGVNQTYVSMLENGKRLPSEEEQAKLAAVLPELAGEVAK